jgi:ABC-type sugar transport system substrate-binding protein
MRILFLFLFFSVQPIVMAKPLNVTILIPHLPTDPYWQQITNITQAAADDLSINLTVVNKSITMITRYEQYDLIKGITQQKEKPDYLIFMPYLTSAKLSFDALEAAKIKFFTIEQNYKNHSNLSIGYPQSKYKYWIGENFYNHQVASQALSNYLINKAKNNLPDNQVPILLGLSGDHNPVSSQRKQGLIHAAKLNDVPIKQVISVNWRREVAEERLLQLAQRHGKPSIVWCASDYIAFGALDASKILNLLINKDLYIGGFDWVPQAIEKINNNTLTGSVGGDIFRGAGILLKIYDHERGVDTFNIDQSFEGEDLALITIDNIHEYHALTQVDFWDKINYKSFSQADNKQAQDFTLRNILQLLSSGSDSATVSVPLEY